MALLCQEKITFVLLLETVNNMTASVGAPRDIFIPVDVIVGMWKSDEVMQQPKG